jgi:hypothetical protein
MSRKKSRRHSVKELSTWGSLTIPEHVTTQQLQVSWSRSVHGSKSANSKRSAKARYEQKNTGKSETGLGFPRQFSCADSLGYRA